MVRASSDNSLCLISCHVSLAQKRRYSMLPKWLSSLFYCRILRQCVLAEIRWNGHPKTLILRLMIFFKPFLYQPGTALSSLDLLTHLSLVLVLLFKSFMLGQSSTFCRSVSSMWKIIGLYLYMTELENLSELFQQENSFIWRIWGLDSVTQK